MSDNPLKDILFERLNTHNAERLISTHNYAELIKYVIPYMMDKTRNVAPYEESAVAISTGILHYILTVSATPSQRQVTYKDVDVDIVLPDIRQLNRDPSLAVIIQICPNCDVARQRLHNTTTIQPIQKNIWLLTPYDCYYNIFDGSPSFSDLLYDIIKFSRTHNQNKLGLLG